jgi:hypothetical protein
MSPMSSALLTITALSLASAGFAVLAMAMDRHWEGIHGRGAVLAAGQRRLLRCLGSGALLASLLACLALRENPRAWVMWFGVLTVAAWIATAVLSYAARHAARAAVLAALLAVASGVLALLLGFL